MPLSAARAPQVTRIVGPLGRLYQSPVVFPAAFIVAFVAAFAVGKAVVPRDPDVGVLYQQGELGVVVTKLRERQKKQGLTPLESRLLGNALARSTESREVRTEVLAAYRAAVEGGSLDSDVLLHTIAMLDDEAQRQQATEILGKWPADAQGLLNVHERLLDWTSTPNRLIRRGIVDVLRARGAPGPMLARAEAAAAVADVTMWSCEPSATPAGLAVLTDLVARKETAALTEHVPATLMKVGAGSDELNRVSACVKPEQLAQLHKALQPLLNATSSRR